MDDISNIRSNSFKISAFNFLIDISSREEKDRKKICKMLNGISKGCKERIVGIAKGEDKYMKKIEY